ncbi:hypothetical protein E5288_WYG004411 [Bos mutus]|uniref:Opalin n=1 Tax=Bos mutus TaxID=72004 RepID=A0A6B0RT09_9CETA|nr:hypothetical protein [Bos mutus]
MGQPLGYSPDHKRLGQSSGGAISSLGTLTLPVGCSYKCKTQANNTSKKSRLPRAAFGEGSWEAVGNVGQNLRHPNVDKQHVQWPPCCCSSLLLSPKESFVLGLLTSSFSLNFTLPANTVSTAAPAYQDCGPSLGLAASIPSLVATALLVALLFTLIHRRRSSSESTEESERPCEITEIYDSPQIAEIWKT